MAALKKWQRRRRRQRRARRWGEGRNRV